MRRTLSALALLLAAALPAGQPLLAAEAITVFAAASLQTALDEAARAYEARSGNAVRISYASSVPLARQITAGAPADLFASADQESMDLAQQGGAIDTASRTHLLANSLVVIAGSRSRLASLDFTSAAWTAALGDGRLSVGSPDSVPAGRYAKEALSALGLWRLLESRVAGAANVRAALTLVARGEAPLGIVYATDARAEPRVKIVATFPQTSHRPIVYPFALTKRGANSMAARNFFTFLKGPDARAAFEKQGFAVKQ